MDTRLPLVLAIALLLVTGPFVAGQATTPVTQAPYDDHLLAALSEDPATVDIIAMTDGAAPPVADQARQEGATVTWTYHLIDGFAATVPTSQLDDVAELPGVVSVHLDQQVTTDMDISHQAIEADEGWAAGYDGSGITVAVIDTGIDVTHPFFEGAIVSCVSTIGGLESPECTDTDGHGTHVAGTVASRDETYPGIAPGASLAAVRVLHAAGSGTSSDIIAGIQWVADNQDNVSPSIEVATMSIGFLEPGCGDGTSPEAQAADALVDSGVFFSVAAGNAGHDSCTIDGFAAAHDVLTVGAVDDKETITQADDEIADFSSGGPTEDGRLKPEIVYPGVGITSAYIGSGVLIATLDGTSMATPHAAGTAAQVLQQDPTLGPVEVKDQLTSTAVTNEFSGSTADNVYGHGLGNVCHALGLSTCGNQDTAGPPLDVHVDSVAMSYETKGKANWVTTTATIVDGNGTPVEGASVTFETTAPDGTVHTGTDKTDATGQASFLAKQKNSAGTWEGCVTDVTGSNLDYVPSDNKETCETLQVN